MIGQGYLLGEWFFQGKQQITHPRKYMLRREDVAAAVEKAVMVTVSKQNWSGSCSRGRAYGVIGLDYWPKQNYLVEV